MLEPTEMADSTKARAVIDLEPGRRTVARTGAGAVGAVQRESVTAASGTISFCRLWGAHSRR